MSLLVQFRATVRRRLLAYVGDFLISPRAKEFFASADLARPVPEHQRPRPGEPWRAKDAAIEGVIDRLQPYPEFVVINANRGDGDGIIPYKIPVREFIKEWEPVLASDRKVVPIEPEPDAFEDPLTHCRHTIRIWIGDEEQCENCGAPTAKKTIADRKQRAPKPVRKGR